MKYTEYERELLREARHSKGMLSAMWVTGHGPRGGKVSVGKGRYDALNLMVLEDKAEALLRFFRPKAEEGLEVYGVLVKVKRIKKDKVTKVT